MIEEGEWIVKIVNKLIYTVHFLTSWFLQKDKVILLALFLKLKSYAVCHAHYLIHFNLFY